jgi:hypothetical protein
LQRRESASAKLKKSVKTKLVRVSTRIKQGVKTEYHQTLTKNGTANGAASNAYRVYRASYVPAKTKCIIMKYRTGTLYNHYKHAV